MTRKSQYKPIIEYITTNNSKQRILVVRIQAIATQYII